MPDDLYREICRRPEDDTLRLAYADWLDENGDPDRAEFIRSRILGHPPDRANALLAARPDWSRCRCPTCEGSGRVRTWDGGAVRIWVSNSQCDTCSGTGDLFFFRDERYPGHVHHTPRTVTFARGFPDGVSCTLSEAFVLDGVPTPWACEVVRRTPVTRFVLADKTPAWDRHGDGMASWYNGTDVILPSVVSAAVPGILLSEMTGEISVVAPPRLGKWFHDVPTAVDALALAAGRLVRRHVYGEATA